jgi:hypothetical protein
LQLVLVLLAAWNLLSFLFLLTEARGLIDLNDIDGLLGGRAAGGSLAALGIAYLYAVRNPVRYRFILWIAAVEQVLALFAMTFQWVLDDLRFSEIALPGVIATAFLVLLIANLPRQTDTMAA